MLTGKKRIFTNSSVYNRNIKKRCLPFEEKHENIILSDNYHESTFVYSSGSIVCINEDRNLVILGGLVVDKDNSVVYHHRSIVCKINEEIRSIAFYDYDRIHCVNTSGNIIDLNFGYGLRYKENEEFGSDIDCIDEKLLYQSKDIVKEISCSYRVGYYLSIDGTLKSRKGEGFYGILNNEICVNTPSKIELIEMNYDMNICKSSENDEFYAWGDIKKDILPIDDIYIYKYNEEKYIDNPVLCRNMPTNIISIKSSLDNIIFLSAEGFVYKCGFEYINENYKIIYSRIPKLIENIPLIKKISSCDVNFILLDYNGNIWTFSKYNINDISDISPSINNNNIILPFIPNMIKRSDVRDVIDISKGGNCTYIKQNNGNIYYFYYENLIRDDSFCFSKLYILEESPDIWRTNTYKSKQKSARKIVELKINI